MSGRIMIVDGVPTNRIVMKVRLAAASHDVTAVGSGQEALDRLAADLPRIVVIGSALPDYPAAELCRALRRRPGGQSFAILVQATNGQGAEALHAGATCLFDPQDDEHTLLARIRSLLREMPDSAEAETSGAGWQITAEPVRQTRLRAVFIADQIGTGLSWRYALQDHLGCDIDLRDPERALSEAQSGPSADLYLIAADIQRRGDGLRLMAELRSRPLSREAAFLVVVRPDRSDLTAMALDLGAADVLPHALIDRPTAAEAGLRIQAQISQKLLSDRRRREARRNLVWAMTDPLTGLYNRRFAMPRLQDMIARSAEDGKGVAVLALDLDRFKRVNDGFGHAAGDQTLIAVAERLRDALPPDALIARIGGEEFIAAAVIQSPDEAQALAEALRCAIGESPIHVEGDDAAIELVMTVSVGVAVMVAGSPTKSLTPELLLARADRALLIAKSQGRNRIVVAPQGLAA
ncbi:diguanylate cyclase domain-containing protein [Paracoccus aminophilus]|uniref:diguanylate cyclase n=1 Tax=Paracoccus aminophilus JCM 7686 TaxID=1367847 RepID=S5YVE2_PARAH|nr:diguanylate cyclase [Paracoccus aminophilus]AGT09181.1 response regulator receiver modulated diguanylate cyclase [Paracoccus aminophilus JCM 7686]